MRVYMAASIAAAAVSMKGALYTGKHTMSASVAWQQQCCKAVGDIIKIWTILPAVYTCLRLSLA